MRLSTQDLMRAHVEAEFIHDDAGDLVRVNEPNGAPAPRFFLGRTSDGLVVRFRHDVDKGTRSELEAATVRDDGVRDPLEPLDPSRYQRILARTAPVQRWWTGPAFSCPPDIEGTPATVRITDRNSRLLSPLLEPWLPDVKHSQPLFAALAAGRAVAICCSVRRTNEAHEAGVETVREHRGQGHGAAVVGAWAAAVHALGRIPLYSTSWQNTASRAVARKLGLICFGSDLHIT